MNKHTLSKLGSEWLDITKHREGHPWMLGWKFVEYLRHGNTRIRSLLNNLLVEIKSSLRLSTVAQVACI